MGQEKESVSGMTVAIVILAIVNVVLFILLMRG